MQDPSPPLLLNVIAKLGESLDLPVIVKGHRNHRASASACVARLLDGRGLSLRSPAIPIGPSRKRVDRAADRHRALGVAGEAIRCFLDLFKKWARLQPVTTPIDYPQLLRGVSLRVTRPRIAVLTAVHNHPHADTDHIIGFVHDDLATCHTKPCTTCCARSQHPV